VNRKSGQGQCLVQRSQLQLQDLIIVRRITVVDQSIGNLYDETNTGVNDGKDVGIVVRGCRKISLRRAHDADRGSTSLRSLEE